MNVSSGTGSPGQTGTKGRKTVVCVCAVVITVVEHMTSLCDLLQSGFDTLNQLIPGLSQSSNTKISKATTLHKGQLVVANEINRVWHESLDEGTSD